MSSPSVFEFLDYREYLKQVQDHFHRAHGFSARAFGKHLGFGSPSYLKSILDRKRALSVRTAQQIGRRLGLKRPEIDFLSALVLFGNEVHDLEKKNELFKELLKFKKFQLARTTDAAEYHLFSTWYVVALLEGLGTPWAQLTESKMCRDLGISLAQLQTALLTLQNLRLIEKVNGKWRRCDAALETPPETASLNIRNMHREMIQKGLEAVDNMETSERALGGLTIAVSVENIERLKARLFEFRQELNAEFSNDPAPSKVMQLNLQLFPLFSLRERKE